MKLFVYAAAAAMALTMGVAHAKDTKSMNKTKGKQHTLGGVGAMQNSGKNGVATNPQQIKKQSGNMKASPGTVGAAPGANVPSSNPKH